MFRALIAAFHGQRTASCLLKSIITLIRVRARVRARIMLGLIIMSNAIRMFDRDSEGGVLAFDALMLVFELIRFSAVCLMKCR